MLTFDEQSKILDHIDEARKILRDADTGYLYQGYLERLTRIFHELQNTEVKP